MSHTVTSDLELKNRTAMEKAAAAMNAQVLGVGRYNFFSSQAANGLGIQLPGWKYPIVVDLESGKVSFDNYNGSWGSQDELDKFMQHYAKEVACEAAYCNNFTVEEQTLDNGDIELTIGGLGEY